MNAAMEKPKKSAVLRARCNDALKNLVQQAAQRLALDESDIIRMALTEYTGRISQPVKLNGQG